MATSRRLLVLWAAASAVGCVVELTGPHWRHDAEVSESFYARVEAASVAELRLEGIDGSVTIIGTKASSFARVSATITVRSDSRWDAEEFLERVSVEVKRGVGGIVVRTAQPARTDGREVIVDYDLVVPSHLDVRVVNVNGDVELRDLDGAIDVDHVNGAVSVIGSVDDVQLSLVNGDIACDVDGLPRGGTVQLSVVNGGIDLEIPASTSAMFEGNVTNGSISLVGLDLFGGTASANAVRGRLGTGDGLIELDVVNGIIVVRGR